MDNLKDLLLEQLKDLYSAENQLIEALPKMVQGAVSQELSEAFASHLKETENHLARLDTISRLLAEDLGGHTCQAMRGLVKEGAGVLAEHYEMPALKDIMLVAAAQRVEHYEIAGYGCAIALAEYLELDEIVAELEETITEKGEADNALTDLCETTLFDACISPESQEEDDEEEPSRV